ncbi:hypothetical protein GCM10023183_15580 [Nibribacter koreensis]|uniref:Uncharacterized protein n=1 Tax=Nibribacter koreensis TaxID=1084519 RepID=A0ABP8FGI6_9BACT
MRTGTDGITKETANGSAPSLLQRVQATGAVVWIVGNNTNNGGGQPPSKTIFDLSPRKQAKNAFYPATPCRMFV